MGHFYSPIVPLFQWAAVPSLSGLLFYLSLTSCSVFWSWASNLRHPIIANLCNINDAIQSVKLIAWKSKQSKHLNLHTKWLHCETNNIAPIIIKTVYWWPWTIMPISFHPLLIVSSEECNKLYYIFLKLDYPVNSAICKFLHDIENIRAPKDINDDSPTYHGPGTI